MDQQPLQPSTIPTQQQLDNLPTIIARPLYKLLNAVNSAEIIKSADMATDFTLRFLGLVCMSQYLADFDWNDKKLTNYFEDKLKKPSLGIWYELINTAVSSAQKNNKQIFFKELRDTWIRCEYSKPLIFEDQPNRDEFGRQIPNIKKLGNFEVLVFLRNKAAHGSLDTDQEASKYKQYVFDALHEYKWLSSYQVRHFDSKGEWWCKGVAPILQSDEPQTQSHTYVKQSSRIIELLPLVVSHGHIVGRSNLVSSEIELYSEIALYNGWSDNEILYTGPKYQNEKIGEFREHSKGLTKALSNLIAQKAHPVVVYEEVNQEAICERIGD